MQAQREHWSSQLGFVLAAAGSAIGLGTLWMFPYIASKNGGGAFVLAYIAFTFFLGIPIFIAELVLGRRAQRGAVGIFASLSNDSTGWKAVGWLGVAASFFVIAYYSVIAGWGLNYALMSLNRFWAGRTAEEIAQTFNYVSSSADITLFWQAIFMALTVAVVYPGIRKGIEYWSKFMTTGLLLILVVLCLYSLSLEGFGKAVNYLLYPDFSRLRVSGILEALGLSLFTLSLGQGIMLTYGSYMRSEDDIPKTAIVIGFMIVLVAILSSLIVFPIIFSAEGAAISGGPGLVFQTLPLLFSRLPGALLISTAYFTLFVFAALTSAISFIEVVVANFIDLYGVSRHRAVLWVGLACFAVGIPCALSDNGSLFSSWSRIYGISFFSTLQALVSDWLLPLGGLMTAIFAGWKVDHAVLKEEFQSGTALPYLWGAWIFFIRWIAPVAIILIFLHATEIINVDALLR